MNPKRSKFLHEDSAAVARIEFLKSENYCSAELPSYFDFTPLLSQISQKLMAKPLTDNELERSCREASQRDGVNYILYTNKDGRLSWRPLEIIHPVLYVFLVHLLTEEENWKEIQDRFATFGNSRVERCSGPFIPSQQRKKTATDILNYWETFEQRSLELSLDYSVLYQTDISNCYGSIYTHSISWALHGKDTSKNKREFSQLLGNKIDTIIRAGRRGETMGIPQSTALSDFIAELVLQAIDLEITELLVLMEKRLGDTNVCKILRYRDDYRVFANNDSIAEEVLRIISSVLQGYRLTLGSAKTFKSSSLISGSIKSDKIAAIGLDDMGVVNAKTLQKRLLRIHSYSLEYPRSRRIGILLDTLTEKYEKNSEYFLNENLGVCLAIIAELSFQSPIIFPFAARLISVLCKYNSVEEKEQVKGLWEKLQRKVGSVSNKGLLELWLQRIALANKLQFKTKDSLCCFVNKQIDAFFKERGKKYYQNKLWNYDWIPKERRDDWGLYTIPVLSCNPAKMKAVIEQKEVSAFLTGYR